MSKPRTAGKCTLAFECDEQLRDVVVAIARAEEVSASHVLRRIIKAKLAKHLKPGSGEAEVRAT
jgi:hypothetical protein